MGKKRYLIIVVLLFILLFISSCYSPREDINFKEIRNLSDLYQGIVDVNGSLVFSNGVGVKVQDRFFLEKSDIYVGNKKITSKYAFLSSPKSINGRLAYIGVYRNKSFAVFDGKEFGDEFDSVSSIFEVNKDIAYIGIKGEKSYVVLKGIPQESYDLIFPDVIDFNSKIAYAVEKDKKLFVIEKEISRQNDGISKIKEYGPYERISFLTNYNSKLVFIASRDGKEFVVIDGKEILQDYQIYGLKKIGNHLFVLVQKDNKYFIVSYSENSGIKEIGKEYDGVFEIENINETLAYTARNVSNGKFLIVVDDKIIARDYDFISDIADVDGNLAFIAQKGESEQGRIEKFIKYKGRSIRNYKIERENPIHSIGGKLVFIAKDTTSGNDLVVIEE